MQKIGRLSQRMQCAAKKKCLGGWHPPLPQVRARVVNLDKVIKTLCKEMIWGAICTCRELARTLRLYS